MEISFGSKKICLKLPQLMLVLTMKCGIYIQLFRVEEDTVTI
jgi:hypothetical protein